MAHYKKINSREIENSDPSINYLRIDTLELAKGETMEKVVVNRKDGVKILPLTPGNEVLLIQEHRYAAGGEVLMLPGGAIDGNEEPIKAAQRELFEETGYEAEVLENLFVTPKCSSLVDEKRYFYLARGLYKPEKEREKDSWESISLCPLSLEAAVVLASGGDFPHPETNLAVLLAAEKLKNGQ